MNIQEGVREALRGGWVPDNYRKVLALNPNNRNGVREEIRASYTANEILLDPLFWKALGGVEGWPDHNHMKRYGGDAGEEWVTAFARMHRFVDLLFGTQYTLEEAFNDATS